MAGRSLVGLIALVVLAGACRNPLYVRPELAAPAESWDARAPDLRVLLIGDAGAINAPQRRVRRTAATLARQADDAAIVWLGDNIYQRGLPAAGDRTGCGPGDSPADELRCERARARAVLRSQVEVGVSTGTPAYFVPGNHDWDRSGPLGRERILALQESVLEDSVGTARLLPDNACPGPLFVDLGTAPSRVRMIFVDTEWMLAPERGAPHRGCTWGDADAPEAYGELSDNGPVFARLRQLLAEAGEAGIRTVVAGHHPLYTRGSHGGYHPPSDYIFPFRVWKEWLWVPVPVALLTGLLTKVAFGEFVPVPLGVLYPPLRRARRAPQDLGGVANQAMVAGLLEAFRTSAAPPLIYTSGHEHDLQVFEDPGDLSTLYVVSGSAAKSTPTGVSDQTLVKTGEHGFMVLDFFTRGTDTSVRLETIVAGEGLCGTRTVFCGKIAPGDGTVEPCGIRPCF